MKFLEFQSEVEGLISRACASAGFGAVDPDLNSPPGEGYGDLSSAVCIRLGKQTAQEPAEIAIRLASLMMDRVRATRYVGGVTPHRAGYLNFTINMSRFASDSVRAVLGGDLGSSDRASKRITVEHTNVNPNKALHIGHARNLVLGDSLVNVLRYLGDDVKALNYVDDSGSQFADVIVGFKFLGYSDQPPPGTKFDAYCGDSVYTKVTQRYSEDPALKQKQSLVLRAIEEGKGEIADYARSVVKRILAAQLETCWRLGASYDLLNWESQVVHSGMWERVFAMLKENGIVKLETEGDNKGCWVIPDPETGEQKVVVRSDGTAVYVAKDIPYAAWKIGLVADPFGYELYQAAQPNGSELRSTVLSGGSRTDDFAGADQSISVIDVRQAYLQKIVAKVLESMKGGSSTRYLHRGYEVVALSKSTAQGLGFKIEGEFAHMSGRAGLYVNVDAVLDRLRDRAKAETRKRNLKEPDEWVGDVSEAIAVAALRYELLKQDPDKIIVFDMEDALKLQGDTGPYLLYTYARARRILDKTEGTPRISEESASLMKTRQEARLVKKMSALDIGVARAGEFLSPREVAKFAHELAVCINDFYESVQVNREPNPSLRDARLALVDAASRVLAQSMAIIGVPRRSRI